ncbi:hypothetical protein ENBRE01_1526 [Enteropsectra breve]|nr:hypothetical protein ENBRE01_1526 [Enteropsectra breve]
MTQFDANMDNAFAHIDESDEVAVGDQNHPNSLKLMNYKDEEINSGAKVEDDFSRAYALRRKKEKRKKKKIPEELKKPSNRKIVNLPASRPYVKLIDGEKRLCFKYNTKVSETALNAMPKADLEDNEFSVRYDLESVDISKLNEKFKADNCVYPRANIPYEMYMGNRWNYETECNRLAWQFVSLNPVLLYGKKGLIQRAVDSFRKINKCNKGQEFYKDDTFYGDIEKRKHAMPALLNVQIQWTSRGVVRRCKVQTGVEGVDYTAIPEDFKAKYSVLSDYFDSKSFGLERWESRNVDNELAIKIAFLNVENSSFLNAIKAIGLHAVIKKAVEAYKAKKEEVASSEDDTEAFDAVNATLDKAFDDAGMNNADLFYGASTDN